MAEIKSFREYIAEQEEIKNRLLFENDSESESEQEPEEVSEPEPEKEEADKNQPQKTTTQSNPSHLYVYDDFEIKYSNSNITIRNKESELLVLAKILKRTIDALRSGLFLTAKGFDTHKFSISEAKKQNQESARTYINVTNSASYATVLNNWLDKNREMISRSKESFETYKPVLTLLKNKDFETKKEAYDYLMNIAKEGKQVPQAILDTIKKQAEAEEAAKAAAERETKKDKKKPEASKIFKEETLDEENWLTTTIDRLRNKFRTPTEVAKDNRFNSTNIITKAGGKNPEKLYNKAGEAEEDTKFYSDVYKNYRTSGADIIRKGIGIAKSYYNRAMRTYNNKNFNYRYVGDDDKYLRAISGDLFSCLSKLLEIGYSLNDSMSEFEKSLNKLSRDFKLRKDKQEKAYQSFDADTSVQRFEKELGKVQEKNAKKAKPEETPEQKADRLQKEASIKTMRQNFTTIARERFKSIVDKYKNDDVSKAFEGAESDLNNDTYFKRSDRGIKPDNQKKAEAMALLTFILGKKDIDSNKERTGSFDIKIKDEIFDKYFDDVFEKYDNRNYEQIMSSIKRKYVGKPNKEEEKANRALTDVKGKLGKFKENILKNPEERKAEKNPKDERWAMAKDFNGVKPQSPQAANIFDYAVEKAKKLKER